ncbi:alpha/beta fold hydrolase [Pseudonocardia acaciae]|uniref:alpha/beta fold hydrolase n=1 Tax=Pseudonocardia acaciae TaxID=551276 RepID=UPI000490F070|nr:alpha/beta hydrolase [Pseudonocardia acaciae]
MPTTVTDDGVRLYYEEAGAGTPLVFVHEFGGDHRSWEPQLRHFARRYRCVAFAARGFPPSDVPDDPARYGQHRAADDVAAVIDALGGGPAHVVGNSMGGFATLHLGLRHPGRARSLVVAGCGYGAHPDTTARFRAESEKIAAAFESDGSAAVADWYGLGPARVQFEAKDPRGHAEHVRVLAEHDATGAALTMRNVQAARPSLYDLRAELAALDLPVLVVAGDEDEGVLETDLMLKRTIPRAGLAVLPRSGHLTNLEEPTLFNSLVEDFLARVDAGRWDRRDPRSLSTSTTGATT